MKISILIHGTQEDDAIVKKNNLTLQHQLNEMASIFCVNDIEVIFCLDNNKTPSKRKKWCLAHTTGEYYTELLSPYLFSSTYLRDLWFFLNDNEKDEEFLSKHKIYKRKPWQKNLNLMEFTEIIKLPEN